MRIRCSVYCGLNNSSSVKLALSIHLRVMGVLFKFLFNLVDVATRWPTWG